jgi:DUF1680 family protein
MKVSIKLLGVLFVGLLADQPFYSMGQENRMQAFPLSSVRLLESSFKEAQQTDARYILSLDADKLLAPFLKDAGLPPVKENYGNWENTGLDGHIAGHYISALAEMYAATGDKVFLDKQNYMLDWLEKCQRKNGNGYVGGVPNAKEVWQEVAAGNVGIVWKRWVPWYNIHKTYSGLVDAYELTGSTKAKEILLKLSEWCWQLTSKLTDTQMEQMLANEYGGMNEVFANVAVIANDNKYLELAKRFSHRAILNPLMEQKDALTGLHANTQIPKVVGFMRTAMLTNNQEWANASDFFWNTVVHNRSISIGGNSVREHFHSVDDFNPMLESREGPETCNSYNMLKLSKLLFLAKPSASYMDYYERTMYNHILSSQHPDGGFVYFTPIRPRHYRVYSTAQQSFWCCVGSGIENHGKYGEMVYAHDNNNLYVNLFVPSSLQWKEKGLSITQQTTFPNEEQTQLTITAGVARKFEMYFRKPSWAGQGYKITVNGKVQHVTVDANSYVSVNRIWKKGDVIKIILPMSTKFETLPDKSNWVSFVHGPIVLAAVTDTTDMPGLRANDSRWGHIAGGKFISMSEAPLLLLNNLDSVNAIKKVKSNELAFSASDIIYQEQFKNLRLVPFSSIHDARYMLYWPYTTQKELPVLQAAMREKAAAQQLLESATIDMVYPGEQQPENDHAFKGDNTQSGFFREKHFRNGKGWFSYTLRNTAKEATRISLIYYGAEKDKQFDVYVNEQLVSAINLKGNEGNNFITKVIELPSELRSSDKITLTLKAKPNSAIAGIYEVRLLNK